MDIFCKIIKKEEKAEIIYEDEDILAFLDKDPQTKGHTLIISKDHYEGINDIPTNTLNKIMAYAKIRATELSQEYNGIKIGFNSGTANEIGHFHCHILGIKKLEK